MEGQRLLGSEDSRKTSRVACAERCHKAQQRRGRLAEVENGSGIGKLICETGH